MIKPYGYLLLRVSFLLSQLGRILGGEGQLSLGVTLFGFKNTFLGMRWFSGWQSRIDSQQKIDLWGMEYVLAQIVAFVPWVWNLWITYSFYAHLLWTFGKPYCNLVASATLLDLGNTTLSTYPECGKVTSSNIGWEKFVLVPLFITFGGKGIIEFFVENVMMGLLLLV